MMVSENGKGVIIYVKIYCVTTDSDTVTASDAGVETIMLAVLWGALHDRVDFLAGGIADAGSGGVHYGHGILSGWGAAGAIGMGGQSVWFADAGDEDSVLDWQFGGLDTG